MAQIPVFRPDQIIEQGSPMEIGNSGVYMGDAIQTLGKGLGELTEVMYKEQLKTKQRIDEDLLTINNENTKQYMARLAKVAESTELDENDPYGFKAADELQKSAKGFIQKNYERLLKTTDAATARKYMASAVEDLTVLDAKALATRGEKQLKFVEQNQQVFSNALIAQAREGEDLEVLRVKYLDSIMDNPTIPDVEKPRLVSEFDQSIKQSKLEGMLDQGKAGDYTAFTRAEDMVKELAKSGDHDYKFTKDMQTLVETTKTKTVDWDYKVLERSTKLLEQEQKANMQKAYDFYTKELSQAGNNDSKVQAIMAKIEQDPAFNINPQARKDLAGITVFKEMRDDQYEFKLIERINNNQITMKQALDKVSLDMTGKTKDNVSVDRANKLQTKLSASLNDESKWTPLNTVFADEKKYIMSHFGADFLRDPNGYIDNMGDRMQAANATAALSRWYAQRRIDSRIPTPAEIHAQAKSLLIASNTTPFTPAKGIRPDQYSNLERAQETMKQLGVKYRMSRDAKEKKEIAEQMKGLSRAVKDIPASQQLPTLPQNEDQPTGRRQR